MERKQQPPAAPTLYENTVSNGTQGPAHDVSHGTDRQDLQGLPQFLPHLLQDAQSIACNLTNADNPASSMGSLSSASKPAADRVAHTPGPWFAGASGSFKVATITSTTGIYADVMPSAHQIAADARLIAAAPELYEALRLARALIASHRQDLHDCHATPDGTVTDELGLCGLAQYDDVLGHLDAALAKATGGAA